jgi:hypothetical protein
MKPLGMRRARLFMQTVFITTLIGGGSLFARTDDGVKLPVGFQRGYLANSMLVTKEPNKTGLITGVHLIYVSGIGATRFKRGGATAYPDGTVLVDDVREFSVDDGVYHQGGRKFLTTMVKDSKKYAATGGWGFQAWVGETTFRLPCAQQRQRLCVLDLSALGASLDPRAG